MIQDSVQGINCYILEKEDFYFVPMYFATRIYISRILEIVNDCTS